MTDPVDHLEHYGIKGMKWGTRRKRGANGRVSVDARTTRDLRKRPPSSLTNMQLKKVNERMQLESKFNQMNPGRKDRGRMKVKAVMGTAAGAVSVYNMVNSPAGKAAISAGKSAMGGAVKVGARAPAGMESLLRKV